MPENRQLSKGTSLSQLSNDLLEIQFSGALTMSAFERELAALYSETCKVPKTIFDLTNVEWIGYFPAKLLFSWIAALALLKNRQVGIKLPSREALPAQVRKSLLDYGILQQIANIGVEVPYSSSPRFPLGIPLTVVSSNENLWENLQDTSDRLGATPELPDSSAMLLKDAFELIAFELLENALVHTGSSLPHYGVALARSSGSSSHYQGWMSVFDKDTQYVEVYVGDLGPGVQYSLGPQMPEIYKPPFNTDHRFLKDELVLSYAFEFSTTSDEERRKAKVHELLTSDLIDAREIATGLYCVLEFARLQGAQFIMRTPRAVLSFDFYLQQNQPVIKGRKELGIKSLGLLPGTHYLIRLPLTRVDNRRSRNPPLQRAITQMPIRVIDAFQDSGPSDTPEMAMHLAIKRVDEHLITTRLSEGLTVIAPSPIPLPSRGEAVFLAAVQAMNHGQRRVVWISRRASATVRKQIGSNNSVTPRSKIGGQAVLVGDLISNDFTWAGIPDAKWESMLEAVEAPNSHVRLASTVHKAIRTTYNEHALPRLRSILSRDGVKHSGKPFLIEKQYYTDVFFEVGRIWENADDTHMFAEWAFEELEPQTNVLISHSATSPWVRALADLIKKTRGIQPKIIEHGPDSVIAKTIAQTVSLVGQHAVVITDVICTGDRLKELLDGIAGVQIDQILALIDGRLKDTGQPIAWGPTSGRKLLNVRAVLTQGIQTYHEPPTENDTEVDPSEQEHVYVIDRMTRAPTLYVRPAKPRIDLGTLLRGSAREADALLYSHSEHQGKHYSLFLDLPRLFAALKNEIEAWVREQVDYVDNMSEAQNEPWHGYVYDPDNSLTWMQHFLPVLIKQHSIRVVRKEQLKAPGVPRSGKPSGHHLIILPALASGETARLCIEYVSRQGPASILVLCIASRADPYNLTFLTSVRRYRDAALRMACFLDFPVAAFAVAGGICPQCIDLAELERIRTLLPQEGENKMILAEALNGKISANQAMPLDNDQHDESQYAPSDRDYERAHIRALYESSAINYKARRQLNAWLEQSPDAVDRFLEVLAIERFSQQFSKEELSFRLFKVEPIVYERLADIVFTEKPPFRIGQMMGAVIRLAPHVLVAQAIDLIRRFSASRRDVEDICIALLQIGVEPPDVGEFFNASQGDISQEIKQLFKETLDVLRQKRGDDRRKFDESIDAVRKLWAQLVRSTQFYTRLRTLVQSSDNPTPWSEIQSEVDKLWRAWRVDISELIGRVELGPLWPQLAKRHINLGRFLSILDRSMAHLARLGKTTPGSVADEVVLLSYIHVTASEVEDASEKVASRLYDFFVNPALCAAAQLGDRLVANNGSILNVKKSVDQYVGVFCDMENLDYMCGQLIENWQRHKQGEGTGTVWFNLFRDERDVVLEFGDDFGGDFDLKSEGGLGVVRNICVAFGGAVESHLKAERKVLELRLRLVEIMPTSG